jgi:hypothetical protein
MRDEVLDEIPGALELKPLLLHARLFDAPVAVRQR